MGYNVTMCILYENGVILLLCRYLVGSAYHERSVSIMGGIHYHSKNAHDVSHYTVTPRILELATERLIGVEAPTPNKRVRRFARNKTTWLRGALLLCL